MEFGTYIEYLAIILLAVWCLYRFVVWLADFFGTPLYREGQ